jgi:hypothetical protein
MCSSGSRKILTADKLVRVDELWLSSVSKC